MRINRVPAPNTCPQRRRWGSRTRVEFTAGMDTLSPAERSHRMSLVRSSGTKPELRLERLLRGARRRFTRTERALPGSPDFAFPSARKAIFLHGCFWHRHQGCARTRVPKTKRAFWLRKFEDNVRRDRRVYRRLNRQGWSYMVVWECQLDRADRLKPRLDRFLSREGAR